MDTLQQIYSYIIEQNKYKSAEARGHSQAEIFYNSRITFRINCIILEIN
jgi:hypothetical protein